MYLCIANFFIVCYHIINITCYCRVSGTLKIRKVQHKEERKFLQNIMPQEEN